MPLWAWHINMSAVTFTQRAIQPNKINEYPSFEFNHTTADSVLRERKKKDVTQKIAGINLFECIC